MISFIPSWYSSEKRWHCEGYPWYRNTQRTELDDTVYQLRMFREAGEKCRIVMPGYMPGMRQFFHRTGLGRTEVWSLFDEIQGIRETEPGLFSYRDFLEDDGLEISFTPFLTAAYRDGELYAQIEFGEVGQVIWIDYFKDRKTVLRKLIDDRGFVSGAIFYTDGKPVQQEYYDPGGGLRMRHNLVTGRVRLLNARDGKGRYETWASMDAMIEARLNAFLAQEASSDTVVLAWDDRYDGLGERLVRGGKKIFSFFHRRYGTELEEQIRRAGPFADAIVTDSQESFGDPEHVFHITPYDARIALGKSQEARELKILFYVHGADLEDAAEWLGQLIRYRERNRRVEIRIGCGPGMRQDGRLLPKEIEGVSVMSCRNESEIIALMKDTRLLLDFSKEPDLYLQIAGISAGIPQINAAESRYVSHKKNGWILKNRGELPEALDYYLGSLDHWNRALVASLELIGRNRSGSLAETWKETILR